jgi:hypothetical protein
MKEDCDETIPTNNALTQTTSDVAKPPDGGYGWVIVACNLCINCFTWGVISVSACGRRCSTNPINHGTVVWSLSLILPGE